jgi:hypothetical protein
VDGTAAAARNGAAGVNVVGSPYSGGLAHSAAAFVSAVLVSGTVVVEAADFAAFGCEVVSRAKWFGPCEAVDVTVVGSAEAPEDGLAGRLPVPVLATERRPTGTDRARKVAFDYECPRARVWTAGRT